MIRRGWLSRPLLYATASMGAAIYLFPFFWLLRSSFMSITQIFVLPPVWVPQPFHFENYVLPFKNLAFGRYYLNTATIVAFTVAGVLCTSSLAAYSFSRLRWRLRDVVFSIILSSMMLPFAVTLIPTYVGWVKLGQVGTFIPLIVPAWFGGGAFSIFLQRQFFLTIPKEMDEAAYMDGSSRLRVFLQIVIPLSKSALLVVGIFSFIYTWNDFLGPLIYLNRESRFTLALGLLQFSGMYSAQWHLLMAASALVILPVVVVFMVGQKYIVQGITLTGMKA